MSSYSKQQIRESRDRALTEIEKFLVSEDVNGQFDSRSGDYYSKDKFIVTWKANHLGYAAEHGIHKVDSFYSAYSGNKAIWANVGLFHEKQIKGYSSIWRALIDVGLELSLPKNKKSFYDKYVPRYNEWVKSMQPLPAPPEND